MIFHKAQSKEIQAEGQEQGYSPAFQIPDKNSMKTASHREVALKQKVARIGFHALLGVLTVFVLLSISFALPAQTSFDMKNIRHKVECGFNVSFSEIENIIYANQTVHRYLIEVQDSEAKSEKYPFSIENIIPKNAKIRDLKIYKVSTYEIRETVNECFDSLNETTQEIEEICEKKEVKTRFINYQSEERDIEYSNSFFYVLEFTTDNFVSDSFDIVLIEESKVEELKSISKTELLQSKTTGTKSIDPEISAGGILADANTTYTLNQSVNCTTGNCFAINATNITLDCNGFSITGNNSTDSKGIYSNQSYTKIINCNILNFSNGIHIDSAQNANITNNTITLTYQTSCSSTNGRCNGISLGANYSFVNSNQISASQFGITILNGVNNLIQFNSLTGSTNIIYFSSATHNIVQNNNVTALALAITVQSSYNNTVKNNRATTSDYRALYLSSSSNNNVTGNYLQSSSTSTSQGTLFLNSANSNIFTNNTINQTRTGSGESPIRIGTGSHNIFQNNLIRTYATATNPAIYIAASQTNNTFFQNNITAPVWINNLGTNNYFNSTTQGNIYYFSNGTPSWEVYDISDSNSDSQADWGSDYPFSNETVSQWVGYGNDSHPYTENYAEESTGITTTAFIQIIPTNGQYMDNWGCQITPQANSELVNMTILWQRDGTIIGTNHTVLNWANANQYSNANLLSSVHFNTLDFIACGVQINDSLGSSIIWGESLRAYNYVISAESSPTQQTEISSDIPSNTTQNTTIQRSKFINWSNKKDLFNFPNWVSVGGFLLLVVAFFLSGKKPRWWFLITTAIFLFYVFLAHDNFQRGLFVW